MGRERERDREKGREKERGYLLVGSLVSRPARMLLASALSLAGNLTSSYIMYMWWVYI